MSLMCRAGEFKHRIFDCASKAVSDLGGLCFLTGAAAASLLIVNCPGKKTSRLQLVFVVFGLFKKIPRVVLLGLVFVMCLFPCMCCFYEDVTL